MHSLFDVIRLRERLVLGSVQAVAQGLRTNVGGEFVETLALGPRRWTRVSQVKSQRDVSCAITETGEDV